MSIASNIRNWPNNCTACNTGNCRKSWDRDIPEFPADQKGLATRESSAKVLNAFAKNIPWLIGGSADLAPSTKTRLTFEGAGDFSAENYGGRNFHYGVREHAMAAVVNGMSLVKVRPFGSGFLIFIDYMRGRPALKRFDGIAGDLRVHPRLHRSRRGWPHSSAGRTACAHARRRPV